MAYNQPNQSFESVAKEKWIFRKNKIYDCEMITTKAENIANELSNGKLTKTQVRKFYNEFKKYHCCPK